MQSTKRSFVRVGQVAQRESEAIFVNGICRALNWGCVAALSIRYVHIQI